MDTSRVAVFVRAFAQDSPFTVLMRQGFAGLTDREYLWEPVSGSWSIRPRGETVNPSDTAFAGDDWGLDIVYPDPHPPPFTTIAWRTTHLTGSMFVAAAALAGRHRADGTLDESWPEVTRVARTAAEAVGRWERAVGVIRDLLATSSEADMDRTECVWWDRERPLPVFDHVLHYGYFEASCHGAEIRLIRDLYRHTAGGTRPLMRSTAPLDDAP